MAKTALEQWDETAANNTDVGSINIDEGCSPSGMNNAHREEMAQFAKWLGDDTVASAATADLGAVPGRYINITGTTTITAFGTIKAGTVKYVKFAGALTLTHNATSLILPGAANIVTAAGDAATFVSEGSGNWRCLAYQRSTLQPVRAQAWELITTQVPSGAGSVVATGLSAYRAIRVSGYLIPSQDDNNLLLRTSADNGSSYASGANDYDWQYIRGNQTTASALNAVNDTGILISNNSSVGSDAQEGISFSFTIHQFNQSTYAWVNGESFCITVSGAQLTGTFGGRRKSGSARDALQLIFSEGGNMTGFVTVEGVRG